MRTLVGIFMLCCVGAACLDGEAAAVARALLGGAATLAAAAIIVANVCWTTISYTCFIVFALIMTCIVKIIHDVERGDRLAARVLGVGNRVADHVLQEHLEDAARLLVDEAADALDAAAARQAPNGRLGDACGASLAGQPC